MVLSGIALLAKYIVWSFWVINDITIVHFVSPVILFCSFLLPDLAPVVNLFYEGQPLTSALAHLTICMCDAIIHSQWETELIQLDVCGKPSLYVCLVCCAYKLSVSYKVTICTMNGVIQISLVYNYYYDLIQSLRYDFLLSQYNM